MKLQIKRTRPNAQIPQYQTKGSACFDLHAALERPLTLGPKQRDLVPTGLILCIPEGYEGQVRPRSGLAFRLGVTLANCPGTIDSDYRGELAVAMLNLGEENFIIQPGDRIAQMLIAPVIQVEFEEVLEVAATAREAGGFGSTGV